MRKIGFLVEEQRLRGLGWKVGVNLESVFLPVSIRYFSTQVLRTQTAGLMMCLDEKGRVNLAFFFMPNLFLRIVGLAHLYFSPFHNSDSANCLTESSHAIRVPVVYAFNAGCWHLNAGF
jgi:hypothetical protein